MEQYKPQYHIIPIEGLVPREQIKLVPEEELEKTDPALLVELHNIRRGIEYKVLVPDTPESRNAINLRTGYFQMVAYKEGWKFNSELYQVKYFPLDNSSLKDLPDQVRIFSFKDNKEKVEEDEFLGKLSSENRAGFAVKNDMAKRLQHDQADGLAKMVDKHF